MTTTIDRRLYPFTSRWLALDGLRLHYVDEGAGAPVLCVHGNPTWSFFFRGVIDGLRDAHRVIAADHIGCGLSDKPGDRQYPYTLERRVADLEALVERLDLRDLTLVLHDWGGMIGTALALRQPQRIARVVLLNTAAFLLPGNKPLDWRLRLVRGGGPLASLLVCGLNGFARPATRMAVTRPLAPAVRAAYLAPYDSWGHRIATLRFVQDIPLRPTDRSYALAHWVDQNLDRLRDLPMMLCWGRRDFVFDDDFLAEWCRRFRHARVHTFDDAGHYVLEDAGDRIIPLIREFVSGQALPGAARPASAAT